MRRLTGNALGITLALALVTAALYLTTEPGLAQQGSAPVTIVNPLPLPVNVTNVQPAQQPFQAGTPFTVIGNFESVDLVTVPEGKLLVIEHVSASVNMTDADGISTIGISAGDSFDNADAIDCSPVGVSANNLNHFYTCSSSTKFYVAAGETLRFFVGSGALGGNGGFFRAFVSGHYVESAGVAISAQSQSGLAVSGQQTMPRR